MVRGAPWPASLGWWVPGLGETQHTRMYKIIIQEPDMAVHKDTYKIWQVEQTQDGARA